MYLGVSVLVYIRVVFARLRACVWGVFLVFSPQCARSLFVWAPRCKVVKSPSAWTQQTHPYPNIVAVVVVVVTGFSYRRVSLSPSISRSSMHMHACVFLCVCVCVCEEIIIIKRMEKCNCWGKSRRRDESSVLVREWRVLQTSLLPSPSLTKYTKATTTAAALATCKWQMCRRHRHRRRRCHRRNEW